ncbi:UDP-2,4-diacetamido-2,4,6-trideoxy-beta-L-altropyranose hydrolase [uncultured Aliiroseovarius sp.]|uniref:UDP-2,4-diacetamido-2,4, 6-trideoxy-beta-L-altropyranose hydrolase n=1 Tax=uncultured Aliiroseovarius sp. TaxID=1658783 RepID=UPI00259AD984|nr:UDP-2,4-diacetamido-2,4,6-trideoxy-beta-L-altropyranose hydrolase [uncultured Aliiroseovarius sp.]
MPDIVISALSTEQIGTGHLRRMITLSKVLHETARIIPRFHTTAYGKQILDHANLPFGVNDTLIAPDEIGLAINSFRGHLARINPAVTILDNYFWHARNEETLRSHTGKLWVVDDLADRDHIADVLLDQNAHHYPEAYRGKVPAACKLLVGAPYCLIGEEFRMCRRAGALSSEERANLKPVFLSLGGGDPNRDILRLVRLFLKTIPLRPLNIATGSHIADAKELAFLAREMPDRIGLIFDSTIVATQMNHAAYAVASGGTMTWERAVLGLPAMSLMMVDNQVEATTWLAAHGIQQAFDLRPGWKDEDFVVALKAYDRDAASRIKQSECALSLIDGNGATLVAKEIQALLEKT